MTALPDSSFSPRLALAALVLLCQAGLLCGAVAAEPVVPVAAMSASSAASAVQSHRPRIGLVLSGGGARGLSHVGVLKVLERERIPIDVIAGTSMGAIVGGLYASGMDAKQVDEEVRRLDWDHVFDSRVERREIPQRRKEQDFEVSPLLEVGVGRQGILAPLGSVSSRGLEAHLRRLTLQSAQVPDFNALPTPFRAVATDMETGQPVVLDRGDLATALRSSMSVPGVFAPVEVDGRILGDGGLVNNTPVDVARAMGAERLIVVNIGTPLSKREVLSTLTGVTGQMINILTEQNVQQSLAKLKPTDVLIAPVLDGLSAGDFNRASEFINLGETQAEALVLRMQDLKLSEADYAAWKARRTAGSAGAALPLQAVSFEGSKLTQPELLRNQIETQPGQPFDVTRAERDLRRLAAAGDYLVTDYQLRRSPQGDELVFKLQDKPWGPDYLQVGLDFSADTNGRSAFNLKVVHNRHWLDSSGAEWRNFVRLGTSPSVATEWYRPLPWALPDGLRSFVAVGGALERRQQQLYDDPTGDVDLSLVRRTRTVDVDLGLTWRELGEFRLGRIDEATHAAPELISPTWSGIRQPLKSNERGWRLHGVFDQLDSAFFPTQGWRVDGQYVIGERSGAGLSEQAKGSMSRWELQGQAVTSLGRHSFHLGGRLGGSAGALGDVPRYSLGGFQQLSGYAADQVSGQQVSLVRLGYAWRLGTYPVLRSVYLGGSVEAGKAWQQWSHSERAGWRTGNSLYIGADTALGPIYAAIGNAQGVRPTFMLFVGRP